MTDQSNIPALQRSLADVVDEYEAKRAAIPQAIERDPVAAYRAFRGNHEADELALLPGHMQAGIARYVLCGIKPGSFLRAVFADDFEMARLRADDINLAALSAYQNFLENGCPAACWGRPEHVQAWVEGGGIVGMMETSAM